MLESWAHNERGRHNVLAARVIDAMGAPWDSVRFRSIASAA